MKNLFYFLLLSILLTSCGHFPDGTSVWAEATWLVPLIPFIGAVIFGVITYRKSQSDSNQQTPDGIKEFKEKVPFYKFGQFWFAVVLFIATLVIILIQNLSK